MKNMDKMVLTQLTQKELGEMIAKAVNNACECLQPLQPEQKNILTIEDAATYLSVSKSKLYKLTSAKLIPHSKPAGTIYFQRPQLDKWIEEGKVKTVADIEAETNEYLLKNKKG